MSYRDLTSINTSDLYCNTITVKNHLSLPNPVNLSGVSIINLGNGLTTTSSVNKGYIDDLVLLNKFDPSQPLAITNTTESISPSSGSITTLGGIGVAKKINVNEEIYSKNFTPTISDTMNFVSVGCITSDTEFHIQRIGTLGFLTFYVGKQNISETQSGAIITTTGDIPTLYRPSNNSFFICNIQEDTTTIKCSGIVYTTGKVVINNGITYDLTEVPFTGVGHIISIPKQTICYSLL